VLATQIVQKSQNATNHTKMTTDIMNSNFFINNTLYMVLLTDDMRPQGLRK